MDRPSGDVDRLAAPDAVGSLAPMSPPSSAGSIASAPADEDDGLDSDLWSSTDDDWPGHWGAARLGIP